MEITTTTINRTSRRAAVNALAVVGFIALLFIGIVLAIYSARFVPKAISRIGTAAVSLSSVFKGAEEPAALTVITESPSIPFGDATATATTTATSSVVTTTTTTPIPIPSAPVVITVPGVPAALYGKSDLTVSITDVGYLRTAGETSSYVASTDVPDGKSGAIRFTVINVGTNETGTWDFEASIPTSSSFTFSSPSQRSLRPGDRVEYVLGFDRTKSGDNRTITITVDPDRNVDETNEGNNSASKNVDINS